MSWGCSASGRGYLPCHAHGRTGRAEDGVHDCHAGLVWISSVSTIWACRALLSFPKMPSWPTCGPSLPACGIWAFGKQIFLNGHGQEEVIPLALHQWAKKYQVPSILISLHWETVIHDHLKDQGARRPFRDAVLACGRSGSLLLSGAFPRVL